MTLTKAKKRAKRVVEIQQIIFKKNQAYKRKHPNRPLPNRKAMLKKKSERFLEEFGDKGVILLSRIPHGFYESEMRRYFSQFGRVTRVMHARSPKTGRSCRWAFIEFEYNETAKVVAETMDSFPMFRSVMKCKYLKPEEVRPNMFRPDRMQITETTYPGKKILKHTLEKLNSKRSEKMTKVREKKLKKGYGQKMAALRKLGINCNPLGIEISKCQDTKEKEETNEEEVEGKENMMVDDEENEEEEQEMDEEEMRKARDQLAAKIHAALPESIKKKKKKKKKGDVDEEEPMVLEVDESDDEIQFKTPPHAVKRFVRMSSASPKLKNTLPVKSPAGSSIKKKKKKMVAPDDDDDKRDVNDGAVIIGGVSAKVTGTPLKRGIVEEGALTVSGKKKRKLEALPEANGSADDTPAAKATPKSVKRTRSRKEKGLGSEKKKLLMADDVPAVQINGAVDSTPVMKATPKSAKKMRSMKKKALKLDNETTPQTNGAIEDTATDTKMPDDLLSNSQAPTVGSDNAEVAGANRTSWKRKSMTPADVEGEAENPDTQKTDLMDDGTTHIKAKKLKMTPAKEMPSLETAMTEEVETVTPRKAKSQKQTPGKALKKNEPTQEQYDGTILEAPSQKTPGKSLKKALGQTTTAATPSNSVTSIPRQTPSKSQTPKVIPVKPLVVETVDEAPSASVKDVCPQTPAKTPKHTPGKPLKTPKAVKTPKAPKTPKETPKAPKTPRETLVHTPAKKAIKKTPRHTPDTPLEAIPEVVMSPFSKKTPKVKSGKSDKVTSLSGEENKEPTPSKTVNGVSEEIPPKTVDGISEETPQKVKGKTPKKAPVKTEDGISKKTPAKTVDGISEEMPQTAKGKEIKASAKTVDGVSEDTPLKAKGKTPAKTPAKITDTVAEGTPLKAKGKTPKKTPAKLVEDISEETPVKTVDAVLEETPLKAKGKTPAKTPARIVNGISAGTPLKAKGKTPKKTPAKTVDGISEVTPLKAKLKTPAKTPAKIANDVSEETPLKVKGKTPKSTKKTPLLKVGTSPE